MPPAGSPQQREGQVQKHQCSEEPLAHQIPVLPSPAHGREAVERRSGQQDVPDGVTHRCQMDRRRGQADEQREHPRQIERDQQRREPPSVKLRGREVLFSRGEHQSHAGGQKEQSHADAHVPSADMLPEAFEPRVSGCREERFVVDQRVVGEHHQKAVDAQPVHEDKPLRPRAGAGRLFGSCRKFPACGLSHKTPPRCARSPSRLFRNSPRRSARRTRA